MKTKRSISVILPIANGLVERLRPACERIEIAGSLRRRCSIVGDIEIVVVPKFRQMSMFETDGQASMVDDLIGTWPVRMIANGSKLKKFMVTSKLGLEIQVDMFLQPDPATWGINYLIRTGNAEFSHKMVTRKMYGGFMPDQYRVSGARVWCGSELLETPEENDVFLLWGMEFVPPMYRNL